MSGKQVVVMGVTTAAVAGLAYLVWRRIGKGFERLCGNNEGGGGGVVGSSNVNMSPEEVCEIFEDIVTGMQQTVIKLVDMTRTVKAQMQAQGQSLPEEQLQQYIVQSFAAELKKLEQVTYDKFNTVEEDVREAVAFYEPTCKELQSILGRLRNLYSGVSGEQLGPKREVPADLTIERFLGIFEEYHEALTAAMEVCVEELSAAEPDADRATDAFQLKIQRAYQAKVEAATNEMLETAGLDKDVFQAAFLKFQTDQRFAMKAQQLTRIQNERWSKLGLQG